MFDQFTVDLVLFGHIHNYQRTFPVKFNSADPLNPTKTDNARCDYIDPTTIYGIVGTGGVNFHGLIPDKKAYFVAIQQDKRFGQLDSENGNTPTGQFFGNEPGTASKCLVSTNILDRFTITKSFPAPTIVSLWFQEKINTQEPSLTYI